MKRNTLLKVLTSTILIGILLWALDINDFQNSLKKANLLILILALSIAIPGLTLSTIKWRILLKSQGIYEAKYSWLLKLYLMGMFYSNFMPTDFGGDLFRSYQVGKATNKYAGSFAAVSMERITGFITIVLCAVIGLIVSWPLAKELHLISIVISLVILIALAVGLLFQNRLGIWMKSRVSSVVWAQQYFGKVQRLFEAIYAYKNRGGWLIPTLGISFIFQFLTILYVYLLLESLNIEFSVYNLVLIVPMIHVIGIIPVAINGIGLREGAFVYFFTQMGISISQAFALSLLFRLGSLIPSLVGGYFCMLGKVNYKKSVS